MYVCSTCSHSGRLMRANYFKILAILDTNLHYIDVGPGYCTSTVFRGYCIATKQEILCCGSNRIHLNNFILRGIRSTAASSTSFLLPRFFMMQLELISAA